MNEAVDRGCSGDENDDFSCPICFEPFDSDERFPLLPPCYHIICSDCAMQRIDRNQGCPSRCEGEWTKAIVDKARGRIQKLTELWLKLSSDKAALSGEGHFELQREDAQQATPEGWLNVAVIGQAGSGKSTLISGLTGKVLPTIGVGFQAQTVAWEPWTLDGSRIRWWDSPGNISAWDDNVFRKWMNDLETIEKSNKFNFDVVLIVIRPMHRLAVDAKVLLQLITRLSERSYPAFCITTDIYGVGDEELQTWKNELRQLLRELGNLRELSPSIDAYRRQFGQLDTFFAAFVNSKPKTVYGIKLPVSGMVDLLFYLLCLLPRPQAEILAREVSSHWWPFVIGAGVSMLPLALALRRV